VTAKVEVWSDLHCPWALVAVHRLRRARDELAAPDVVISPRAWPLEWVNEVGTPHDIVTTETAVLANHEPSLFNRFAGSSWPSTFLPAFELVAAARRVGGDRVAEDVDYGVRLAFFRDGVDVSIEAGLVRALVVAGDTAAERLPVDDILRVWRHEPVRADVRADFEVSTTLPIQGSPQVFWPDGTTHHNPGMDDHEWIEGIPRIRSTDPTAPRRLLSAALQVLAGSKPRLMPSRGPAVLDRSHPCLEDGTSTEQTVRLSFL
jgi:predicted DsbA family dithiol-disulfide isomerase